MTEEQSNCRTTGGNDSKNIVTADNSVFIASDLWLVINYAAQGKLDRLDLRIMVALGCHSGIGSRLIAKKLRQPECTIRYRINKIRSMLVV